MVAGSVGCVSARVHVISVEPFSPIIGQKADATVAARGGQSLDGGGGAASGIRQTQVDGDWGVGLGFELGQVGVDALEGVYGRGQAEVGQELRPEAGHGTQFFQGGLSLGLAEPDGQLRKREAQRCGDACELELGVKEGLEKAIVQFGGDGVSHV
jgi:hypothetical protein